MYRIKTNDLHLPVSHTAPLSFDSMHQLKTQIPSLRYVAFLQRPAFVGSAISLTQLSKATHWYRVVEGVGAIQSENEKWRFSSIVECGMRNSSRKTKK